ncbi:PIF1-like helicase-domain-containing protein [Dissophora ornata]|nr:PIF1-like helicase-domain-containing protein [Dissophora ornata]
MEQGLNPDQRNAFEQINIADDNDSSQVFFIDSPAGTRNTYLYTLLLSMVRSNGDAALVVASSGIAALLLRGGSTAHSWFKIPIPINEISVCSVGHRTSLAQLVIQAKVIIWDECPHDAPSCADSTRPSRKEPKKTLSRLASNGRRSGVTFKF